MTLPTGRRTRRCTDGTSGGYNRRKKRHGPSRLRRPVSARQPRGRARSRQVPWEPRIDQSGSSRQAVALGPAGSSSRSTHELNVSIVRPAQGTGRSEHRPEGVASSSPQVQDRVTDIESPPVRAGPRPTLDDSPRADGVGPVCIQSKSALSIHTTQGSPYASSCRHVGAKCAGMWLMELPTARQHLSRSRIPTREAFGHSVRVGMAVGGSTNMTHSHPWRMTEDQFVRIAGATVQ